MFAGGLAVVAGILVLGCVVVSENFTVKSEVMVDVTCCCSAALTAPSALSPHTGTGYTSGRLSFVTPTDYMYLTMSVSIESSSASFTAHENCVHPMNGPKSSRYCVFMTDVSTVTGVMVSSVRSAHVTPATVD